LICSADRWHSQKKETLVRMPTRFCDAAHPDL
jgi:hypothetical protein